MFRRPDIAFKQVDTQRIVNIKVFHDYEETPEEYEKIKTELDWPTISESHYKNLERYLPELKLRPYLYDEFKQVLWGSFIKN